jgi:hypothetical protein
MISEKGDKKVSGPTSLKKLDQCWYFLGGKGEKRAINLLGLKPGRFQDAQSTRWYTLLNSS